MDDLPVPSLMTLQGMTPGTTLPFPSFCLRSIKRCATDRMGGGSAGRPITYGRANKSGPGKCVAVETGHGREGSWRSTHKLPVDVLLQRKRGSIVPAVTR